MSLSRSNAWTVAVVATLTMTVSYIDRSSLAVLAPEVTKDLGIDEFEYGWLQSAFSIAYLVATPLAGWWIDRIGARRGLVISILVWTTIAALHALVPGFGVLFALRIALGIAEGPSFPGSAQTIQRVLPEGDRARGFGVLFTGSSIGGMIVPPLASALFDIGGWQFAFLGTALAGLLWLPAWLLVTRSAAVRARMDHAVVDATGATVDRAPRPSLREVLADRNMVRALCAIAATAPIFGLALSWGAKYLAREWHVKQGDVGDYLWLPPLIFDAAAILFGDLASRQRRTHGAPPRLLFSIGMVLCLALLFIPYARGPWDAIWLVAIGMAGGGIVYTLATADLLSRVAPNAVSFAGGTVAGAQSLALIIANPLIGRSVEATGSYDVATIAVGLWALPGCLLWLLLKPRPAPA